MSGSYNFDVAVIGSGPNGLSAAIELAANGLKVIVFEAKDTAGGAVRSASLTLPGFVHDSGSAVHPMAMASPFFRSLPLAAHGLTWLTPAAAVAHPFDNGTAIVLHRSIEDTARELGRDGNAYRHLISPLTASWDTLSLDLLGNMRSVRHPAILAKFGIHALASARDMIESNFQEERTAGFFAGLCAHSVIPLEMPFSSAIGLVLCAAGHITGWPVPAGGSGNITSALCSYLQSLGGRVETGHHIKTLSDIAGIRTFFFDTSPRDMAAICEGSLQDGYIKAMRRYRYGPGVFKMDWALSGPIPWKDEACKTACTVHLGSSYAEIAAAERAAWDGRVTSRPFVLLAQPCLADSSRAPAGFQTAWAYCHVPNGCNFDMSAYIEAQIERFAPGFSDLILARYKSSPSDLEAGNPNLIGGDITGGAQTSCQLLCRPVCRLDPYSTPADNIYICSASTPPGAGVHGMCGYHAARAYLKKLQK